MPAAEEVAAVVVRRIGRRGQRPGACARSRARNRKTRRSPEKKIFERRQTRKIDMHSVTNFRPRHLAYSVTYRSSVTRCERGRETYDAAETVDGNSILASVVVLTAAAVSRKERVSDRSMPSRRDARRPSRSATFPCPGMRPEILLGDARAARVPDSLAALETGGLAAELNLKTQKRKEGCWVSHVRRRRRARATPAMPSDGPRRHTADRAFFARVARHSRSETRRAPASSARGFRARTHLQGGGGSSESGHLACDGCER